MAAKKETKVCLYCGHWFLRPIPQPGGISVVGCQDCQALLPASPTEQELEAEE